MDIETFQEPPLRSSPGTAYLKNGTPSTFSTPSSPQFQESIFTNSVSEFSLDVEISQLSKLMGGTSLDEKENEKHTTDRFIPLRRHSGVDNSNAFSYI